MVSSTGISTAFMDALRLASDLYILRLAPVPEATNCTPEGILNTASPDNILAVG